MNVHCMKIDSLIWLRINVKYIAYSYAYTLGANRSVNKGRLLWFYNAF